MRELERRAEVDPAACVELARALERVDRRPDALEALWRGCDDLAVRRAASAVERDRAPPRTPRLLWQRKLDKRDPLIFLQASPLALTVRAAQRTAVLDPRTGEQRADLPPGGVTHIHEMLVVCQPTGQALGLDAWTGERLWSETLAGVGAGVAGDGFLFRIWDGQAIGHRWDDPRRAPREAWRWRMEPERYASSRTVGDAVVLDAFRGDGPEILQRVVVLDGRTGEVRLSGDGRVAYAGEGLVVIQRSRPTGDGFVEATLDVHDAATGEVRWSLPPDRKACDVHGVNASTLTLKRWKPDGLLLHLHDRASGARTGELELEHLGTVWPSVRADDLQLVAGRGFEARRGADYVAAYTTAGERLWGWRPKAVPRNDRFAQVRALPGRLYVLAGREVACLVDVGQVPEPGPVANAGRSRKRER